MLSRVEVAETSVNAAVVDFIISEVCADFVNAYSVSTVTMDYTDDKGEARTNEQSLNDTVLIHLTESMLYKWEHQQDGFSAPCPIVPGRELERLARVIKDDIKISQYLPELVKRGVLAKTDKGYTFSDAIKVIRETKRQELLDLAPMKKTVMLDVMPWNKEGKGIAEDARIRMISNDRGSKPSQKALNAVNALQAVKFVIAGPVVDVLPEHIEALELELSALNPRSEDKEQQDKIKELVKEINSAKYLQRLHSKQVGFSFGVTFDWRLRMYYQCAVMQPQGTNLEKAAHQFANSKPMSDEALKAVKVVCANELGRDKLSIDDRVAFMEGEGLQIALDIERERSIAYTAQRAGLKRDKVFTALVNCCEYVRLLNQYNENQGDWSGITSALVCHQDGTCNGIQHAAALLEDRATAVSVNCVAAPTSAKPSDIYGLVATGTNETLNEDIVNRDDTKNAVMVTGYGASSDTAKRKIGDNLKMTGEELENLEDIVIGQIDRFAGAVVKMTKTLKDAVDQWAGECDDLSRFSVDWRTPDGSVIKQVYKDSAFIVMPNGFRYKPSKYTKYMDVDKMGRALSPNFVHSLDADHLRTVVNVCTAQDIELVTVHDSIGSTPADFWTVNKVIRETFVTIHKGNPLKALERWNGETGIIKTGDYDVSEVLESPYFFS